MKTFVHHGKVNTETLTVKLRFPDSVTEEERAVIISHIRLQIVHQAKNAMDALIRYRRTY